MELRLHRIACRETYTIGQLFVDGVRFCDTCEDTDRGLSQDMPESVIRAKKRKGCTAIPRGRYRVTLGVQSPRFKNNPNYAFCKGYLPRFINVKGYDGVLIHIGNSAKDTDGCVLVGKNKQKGMVLESKVTFVALYKKLKEAKDDIYITIE